MASALHSLVGLGIGAFLFTSLDIAAAHTDCGACASLSSLMTHRLVSGGGEDSADGIKQVLIIRVDFADLPGPPRDSSGEFTDDRLLKIVYDYVAPYFETASYGKAGVSLERGAITGVLRMPEMAEFYAQDPQLQGLQADALEAAGRLGVDVDLFDRVAVLLSSLDKVPNNQVEFRGFASIGGKHSWFQGDFSPALVGHEWGHNLGLGHASLWEVPQGTTDPLDPAGQKKEYGHAYDLMGRITYDPEHRNIFNPASLRHLGWLPETTVRTVKEEGKFRIYQLDKSAPDFDLIRGLRIPLDDGRAYWFSHRYHYQNLRHGLVVELADETARTTLLLDMIPGGSLDDADLTEGHVFTDSEVGVVARVAAAGGTDQDMGIGGWVDLEVSFLPRVVFRQADISVLEGQGDVELVLERKRDVRGPISLRWTTAESTATSSSDFLPSSGTIAWEPDDFEAKRIRVPLIANDVEEHVEAFVVRLSHVEGAVVPVLDAVVHIIEPGAKDPSFVGSNITGVVRDIAVQSDGKVVLAGDFRQVGESHARGVARLGPTGSTDLSFGLESGADGASLYAASVARDDRLLLGGAFRRFETEPAESLVRLSPGGHLEAAFNKAIDGEVRDLWLLPSGPIYVAGGFSQVAGHLTPGVARLHPDGSVDTTWRATLSQGSLVTAMVVLPDRRVIVGGRFFGEDKQPYWGVQRLHADGRVDRLLAEVDGEGGIVYESLQITKLVSKSSQAIAVAGDFSRFGGVTCHGLAGLTNDGEIDEAFIRNVGTGPNGKVWDMASTADGKLIMAGSFDWFDGQTRRGVARLDAEGVLDDWDPGSRLKEEMGFSTLKGTAIALQADGGVLLSFTDLVERESRMARVASGLADLPGILEFENIALQAEHGGSVRLPVVRRHGHRGPASIRYMLRAESHGDGRIHAFPAERLFWADGDTQPKNIHATIPSDPAISAVEVQLLDAQGGVQTGLRHTARITLNSSNPRDVWLAANFGAEVNAGALFGTDDDADADGVSNLIEYALDRDPNNALGVDGLGALPKVVMAPAGENSEHCLELQVDLPEPLRPDVRYEVVVTDGSGTPEVLAYHDPAAPGWTMVSPKEPTLLLLLSSEPERRLLQFQDVVPASQTQRRFLQLRVWIDN